MTRSKIEKISSAALIIAAFVCWNWANPAPCDQVYFCWDLSTKFKTLGFVLFVVAVIGFLISLRHHSEETAKTSQPQK